MIDLRSRPVRSYVLTIFTQYESIEPYLLSNGLSIAVARNLQVLTCTSNFLEPPQAQMKGEDSRHDYKADPRGKIGTVRLAKRSIPPSAGRCST